MSLDIPRDSYQPGGGAHASQRHESYTSSSHDSARPAIIDQPVATVFEPRQRSEGICRCFEVLWLATAFCKGAAASFVLCCVSAVGDRLLPWAFSLFHYR